MERIEQTCRQREVNHIRNYHSKHAHISVFVKNTCAKWNNKVITNNILMQLCRLKLLLCKRIPEDLTGNVVS